MSIVCRNKHSCDNLYKEKVVVLDSNVLINIIKAINRIITDKALPRDRQFDEFISILEDFLVSIRLCAHNERIHVSRQVFSQEMNPINHASTLRQTPLFNAIIGDNNTYYHRVDTILNRHLTIFPSAIPASDILQLKRSLRYSGSTGFNMPSDNDLSLLALTSKVGANVGGVLLTDDTNIQEASETLQRSRYVTLSKRRIDTQKIVSAGSLSYLSEVYHCCRLLSPRFFAVFDVLSNYVKGKSSSLPDRITRNYERQFTQVIRSISDIPKQSPWRI